MRARRVAVHSGTAGFQLPISAGGSRNTARCGGMAHPHGRHVLAVALIALLGATLLMGSRPVTASPVLYVRLMTRCFVGVTNTPSPCPTDTWIDEHSGVVRELQTVGGFTLDQVFAPRPDGRWRVAD